MTDAAVDMTRAMAARIVGHEQRRTGSRMLAWDAAARLIGTSSSWLRKFVGSYDDREPTLSIGLRIIVQFDRLAARIDADADRMQAEMLKWKAEIHEALPGASEVVQNLARVAGSSPDAGVEQPLPPRRQ